MEKKTKTLLERIVGIFLIILGILGIFLPILPGWIFIFVGLEFLGINLIFFDKIKEYVRKKMKKNSKEEK